METLTLLAGYLVCGLVGILGVFILWKIADGSIDLSRLISEPNGDASLSRFQFLVFTFVIALSLFLLTVSRHAPVTSPPFPHLPGTALSLLGIIPTSYLLSTAIQ